MVKAEIPLLLLLVTLYVSPAHSDALKEPFTDILINGASLTSPDLTIGSPFSEIQLHYEIPSEQKLSEVRIYKGSFCSIANPFSKITWCNQKTCIIGRQADFDLSFESNEEQMHVFKHLNRNLDFSVELTTLDRFGGINTSCYSSSVKLEPCDKVIKAESGPAGSGPIILEIVDSKSLTPIEDVDIQLSSGPPPTLIKTKPGTIEIRSIPKDGFKIAFSRATNHRFHTGPFGNQYSDRSLKKLTVGLCPLKNL